MACFFVAAGFCYREFRKMKKFFLGCCILLTGCSDTTPQQAFEMPPVPVYAAPIEVRDVPLFFEAVGVVKPAKTAEVKARVSGIIEKIHFTEGERIEAGALLYTLEETSYAISVREAEARRGQTLVNFLCAKKKWERYKSLPNQDLIAKIEWDELESAVILQQAMLKADEARLAAAKLDLERCKIRAPISGFAGKNALQEGNMVGSDPLVTLMQIEPLYIDFSITEKELREVSEPASPIRVYAVGKEECLGEGRVTFMDHAIDPQSGMLAVRGVLSPEHKAVWPGQIATVRVYYGKKEKAQMIPMRAIRTGQDGPYVFTITEDNTVEIRTVKLGPEDNGQIVIESGIEGASRIVTEGQHRLFSGSKIEEVTR
jgi:membrane fusion protein, multidrug efflux system